MNELIKYMQTMNAALAGLVFVLYAVAAVIIFGITVYKIGPIIKKYISSDIEQYEIMKKFYPELKSHISELKSAFERVESTQLYAGLLSAVDKYISYETDPERYCWIYKDELPMLDPFLAAMRDFSGKSAEMNDFLTKYTLPLTPVFHPILKRRVSRMLVELHRYSLLWHTYDAKEVSMDVLFKEIMRFHRKKKKKFNTGRTDRYLSLLDKWFSKYWFCKNKR